MSNSDDLLSELNSSLPDALAAFVILAVPMLVYIKISSIVKSGFNRLIRLLSSRFITNLLLAMLSLGVLGNSGMIIIFTSELATTGILENGEQIGETYIYTIGYLIAASSIGSILVLIAYTIDQL